MKKSEYLHELKENLETKISPEELKDILSDYESFFISGEEEGKTDDEISEELGSPAFLAKSLLEGNEKKQCTHDKRIAMPGRRLCAYFIDSLIAIIPAILAGSFMLSAIALSVLLFVSYPSPIVGSLYYVGLPAYKTGVTTRTGIITNEKQYNESNSNTSKFISDNTDISSGREPGPAAIALSIFGLVFYLLYSLICTLLLKGQTIGKKIMKIKVKRSDTSGVSRGAVFFREFIGKVLLNSIPIIPLISVFTILFTHEHKALHDMLTDTIVVEI